MCYLLTAIIILGETLPLKTPALLECDDSPHNRDEVVKYTSPLKDLPWHSKMFCLEQTWKTCKASQGLSAWKIRTIKLLIEVIKDRMIEQKAFDDHMGHGSWDALAASRIMRQEKIEIPNLRTIVSPIRPATADEQELIDALYEEFKQGSRRERTDEQQSLIDRTVWDSCAFWSDYSVSKRVLKIREDQSTELGLAQFLSECTVQTGKFRISPKIWKK